MANEIALALEISAKGLATLCNSTEGFPHSSTCWDWMDKHPEFRERVLRAKERQADALAYQGIEILDDCDPDSSPAAVNLARARADYRLKLIPKIAPLTMGDRHQVDLSGKVETTPTKDTSPPSPELVRAAQEAMQQDGGE